MFRSVFLTFWGDFRGTEEQRHHLHESPKSMTWPLMILAVGAVLAGLVGIPKVGNLDFNLFSHFLDPILRQVKGLAPGEHHLNAGTELLLILLSVAFASLGIGIAWKFYQGRGVASDDAWAGRLPLLHRVLANKYYVDEFYDATVVRGFWATARGLFKFDAIFIDGFLVHGARNLALAVSRTSGLFDKFVVDGIVNGVGSVLNVFSALFRRVQTGYVSNYALVLAVGMFALVCLYLVLQRG